MTIIKREMNEMGTNLLIDRHRSKTVGPVSEDPMTQHVGPLTKIPVVRSQASGNSVRI